MKNVSKMVGVTLLEVMLVLAVAAMIIVMSVRYYQTATYNQQTNTALQTIQAITAAADSLAQGSGTYDSVTQANIANLMPSNMVSGGNINSPWGGTITVGAGSGQTYSVTFTNTPQNICTALSSRLQPNSKFTSVTSTCTASTQDFTYTYDNSK
ncbi:MAG TPA: type 4 pilus major pilin [Gammaproteobacteria bacterium]|jgi:type IV pilus assembly protein PilA|nr:type 4 pilus major pilin [Gammaproteobacteria bacterium]